MLLSDFDYFVEIERKIVCKCQSIYVWKHTIFFQKYKAQNLICFDISTKCWQKSEPIIFWSKKINLGQTEYLKNDIIRFEQAKNVCFISYCTVSYVRFSQPESIEIDYIFMIKSSMKKLDLGKMWKSHITSCYFLSNNIHFIITKQIDPNRLKQKTKSQTDVFKENYKSKL